MWLFYTSRHRPSIDHDDVIKWKHFRVTGPLWGEFTGPRWIPRTKASDAELWCFLRSVSEYKVEQTMVRLVIWDAISPIMKSLECGKRAPVTAISKKPGGSPRVWQRSPARIYRNDAVTDTILKKKVLFAQNQMDNNHDCRMIVKKTTVAHSNFSKMEICQVGTYSVT